MSRRTWSAAAVASYRINAPVILVLLATACEQPPTAPGPLGLPTLSVQATSLPVGDYVQVTDGAHHSCALRANGKIVCWGVFVGELPAGTFTQVDAGTNHNCAVRSDGTLACWGANSYGQSEPPSGTFTNVSAGTSHSCALRGDGEITCWGLDLFGSNSAPGGIFTQVSAGDNYTCALETDDDIVCWGSDFHGRTAPPEGNFTQVSAGVNHACAVKVDGRIACWGHPAGVGNTPTEGGFTQVSAGAYSCAVKSDDAIACWGQPSVDLGQVTPPPGSFAQVSGYWIHTCALTTSGGILCWGSDLSGRTTPPDLPPDVNIGGPYSGSEGTPIALAGSASDPEGDVPLSFGWDLDADGLFETSGASPTHPFPDNGDFRVTLRVTDARGASTTATATVTVANVVPLVSQVAGATILAGEMFTSGGTFSDPGADTWTGTVSYGDGSGPAPLGLAGMSFAVSHRYGTAGSFNVAVVIKDDDGGEGSGHATVMVLSPHQGVEAVANAVDALAATGSLSVGEASSLEAKLRAALDQLSRGNRHAAINQLGAFINQVNALVRSRRLSASDGVSLTDYANRIITSINR